jgi:diacylglycerol kinase family enzyme
MKTAVIYNSRAGSMLQRIRKHFLKDIKDLFGENSIKAEFFDIASSDTVRILSSAASDGYDAVIAAGGDGTIRSIASYLAGSDIPLGIIPIGTLNHFARNNGIPLNFKDAIKTIANKEIKIIDTWEVNGKIFVNNSSIGIYPTLVRKRDKIQRGILASTLKAIFIAYRKIPFLTIKIETDGEPIIIKTPFVFIGNADYKINLFRLKSSHKTGKGCLNVYYPVSKGIFSITRFSFKALINHLEEDRDYKVICANELVVTSENGIIETALDGEIFPLTQPLHYKIHPFELKIITP